MPKYKVTVVFDRKNPKTGASEKNSKRESEFFSPSAQIAKEEYLYRFRKNEPGLIAVNSTTVVEIGE